MLQKQQIQICLQGTSHPIFFCVWGTHKIRLKFALGPLHSITIPHCLTFLAPVMKLEFLRAAVYQQNLFHSIKTSLSYPCFCSFSSPHSEPFAIYRRPVSKALSAPAFSSGEHINQRVSLVTFPFGWRDWWQGLELSYLYQHWIYQFSALLLVSRVVLTKSTQSFGSSVVCLDSTN